MKKQNKNHIHQTKTAENSYSARTTSSRDSNNSRLDGRPAEQKMKNRQVLEDNDRSIMYPQSFADPAGPLHTQLARRSREGVISLQSKKGRTITLDKSANSSGVDKHGSLFDKKEITSSVETNTLDKSRIRSLLIKGFTIEEVQKMTKLGEKQIKLIAETVQGSDINQGSIDLYTELQRDLSKLVLLETKESLQEGAKRDTNAILNAIKLQAELQEKKIQLNSTMQGTSFSPSKVSKDYINTRDKEILEMEQGGMDYKKIAQITGMSESSVNQALDRAKLSLPDDLIGINPSIITETRGLATDVRIEILRKAKKDKLNRTQVRALANQLKNETR